MTLQRQETVIISANSLWNLAHFRRGLIEALSLEGYRVVAVAPDEHDGKIELPCEQIRVSVDRKGTNPLRDLALAATYFRLLRDRRPLAYLGFTIKPNIYGAIAARLAGVPSLPNVSGLGTAFITQGWLTALVTRLYAFAFAKSAKVLFQNPDDRALFVQRGIVRAEQARLLPGSGIDLDQFRPAAEEPGVPTFLFIGRLLGDKGVREFAAAARAVKRDLPGARFQLLGAIDEGNRTAITRDELGQWVDEGIVEYLGQSSDVRPHIAAATAVVLPSYREGLPRTLLEGAAMARPLIASDVPGCREVAIDGVTGLLCAVRDAGSLAQAMRDMASLPAERRAAMGQAARERVERYYSEKAVIASYVEALKLLSKRDEG